jgi:hypothetical protein
MWQPGIIIGVSLAHMTAAIMRIDVFYRFILLMTTTITVMFAVSFLGTMRLLLDRKHGFSVLRRGSVSSVLGHPERCACTYDEFYHEQRSAFVKMLLVSMEK